MDLTLHMLKNASPVELDDEDLNGIVPYLVPDGFTSSLSFFSFSSIDFLLVSGKNRMKRSAETAVGTAKRRNAPPP